MIRFIHWLMRVFIACWAGICILGVIGGTYGMFSNLPKAAKVNDQAYVGAVILFWGIGFCFWFFPTLTALVVAYFTRPQAWLSNSNAVIPLSAPAPSDP